jgi:hypothetical protein
VIMARVPEINDAIASGTARTAKTPQMTTYSRTAVRTGIPNIVVIVWTKPTRQALITLVPAGNERFRPLRTYWGGRQHNHPERLERRAKVFRFGLIAAARAGCRNPGVSSKREPAVRALAPAELHQPRRSSG